MTKARQKFEGERAALNKIVMKYASLGTKRFYSLDELVYRPGCLDRLTKELIGLVSSLVLRCDDCVRHHLTRCVDEGASAAVIEEALSVGLVVGGSVTIPHLRRALKFLDELAGAPGKKPAGKG